MFTSTRRRTPARQLNDDIHLLGQLRDQQKQILAVQAAGQIFSKTLKQRTYFGSSTTLLSHFKRLEWCRRLPAVSSSSVHHTSRSLQKIRVIPEDLQYFKVPTKTKSTRTHQDQDHEETQQTSSPSTSQFKELSKLLSSTTLQQGSFS